VLVSLSVCLLRVTRLDLVRRYKLESKDYFIARFRRGVLDRF